MLKSVFQVVSTSKSAKSDGVRVLLVAVAPLTSDLQDISFFDANNNSSIELLVTDAERAKFFEPGKKYEVTFKAK